MLWKVSCIGEEAKLHSMLSKRCDCFDSILVEQLFSPETHIGSSRY